MIIPDYIWILVAILLVLFIIEHGIAALLIILKMWLGE